MIMMCQSVNPMPMTGQMSAKQVHPNGIQMTYLHTFYLLSDAPTAVTFFFCLVVVAISACQVDPNKRDNKHPAY